MKTVRNEELLKEFLQARYAHRGFHWNPSVPENSMTAFRRAVEMNIGIELDVHLTKDKKLVVIHDSNLKRTCGVDMEIEAISLQEARQYDLEDSFEPMPTVEEVLHLVKGRVPLLIELKVVNGNQKLLIDQLMESLYTYRGSYGIQSFQASAVRYLGKRYSHVPRGLLMRGRKLTKSKKDMFFDFSLREFWVKTQCKPDFISYCFADRKDKEFQNFRGDKFLWTIRSEEEMRICQGLGAAPIFENIDII